jgi:hypothetical protein
MLFYLIAGKEAMMTNFLEMDDDYYLNYCAKVLSRKQASASASALWQFPIVDTHDNDKRINKISFIFQDVTTTNGSNADVGIIGTFSNLHTPVPLRQIQYMGESTPYHALTITIEHGEVHRYLLTVNGEVLLDPLNPQTVTLDNKQTWSRFFTHYCSTPLSFEEWELNILYRLLDHMLPFHTEESERFIKRYYDGLDNSAKYASKEGFYRLDDSVGEVNFIDKLLCKEERHHLIDYKICIKEIDRLMRQRNPFSEPHDIPKAFYSGLYDEMASGQGPGWHYGTYDNPLYFLQILRRHAVLGAFSHPKYGGNSGGAGWAFLEGRYRDSNGDSVFDWREELEPPLGRNLAYTG